jgi:hypothetical protein
MFGVHDNMYDENWQLKYKNLHNDFLTLAHTIINLMEGGTETSDAYRIMEKHGIVDKDGFQIYEDEK